MRRIAVGCIAALLFFSAQSLFSYNWPVVEPLITSTFGGDKWESFGSGIELYGENLDVRPSEGGEIIFFEDEKSNSSLPGGIGNFIVIEHERKLRTLYAGIDPVGNIQDLDSVTVSDVIGRAGYSGKSARPHLYFAVIDSEFEQYVNPLLLLNTIVDNKSPVIRSLKLETEIESVSIEKSATVTAGKAELLAEIYDPCMSDDFFCPMAPYKIQLFLNGEEIFYLNFESLRYDEGRVVIQSHKDLEYSEFYRDDGFISLGALSLVPGDYRFEILVSDYSENETGRTFKLLVVE